MYSYLKGKLISSTEEKAIIEVGGIGYLVHLAPNHMMKLPAAGVEINLYVSFVIREFSQALYGFLAEQERDLFELLLDISGVGPKLALSIVGHLSLEQLQIALAQKNITLLCNVPGIGKKTAERLLLELKSSVLPIPVQTAGQAPVHLQDAISALINLGYSPLASHAAVTKTLEKQGSAQDLGDLITASLKNI